MERTIKHYNGSIEVESVEDADYMVVTELMNKEEFKAWTEEQESPTIKVETNPFLSTPKYINGELGVIAIDTDGRKVYEDIVHSIGNGRYRYYIQPTYNNFIEEPFYLVLERSDIPEAYWNMKVTQRWAKFSREDTSKEIKLHSRVSYPKHAPDGYEYIVTLVDGPFIHIERMTPVPTDKKEYKTTIRDVNFLA